MAARGFVWELLGETSMEGKADSTGMHASTQHCTLPRCLTHFSAHRNIITLRILEMVTEIRGMGMEVCTTLGMLSPEQARQLKEAGLTGRFVPGDEYGKCSAVQI